MFSFTYFVRWMYLAAGGIAENRIGTRFMSLFFGQRSSEEDLQLSGAECVANLTEYRDKADPAPSPIDDPAIHPFPSVDEIVERLTDDTESEDRRMRAR